MLVEEDIIYKYDLLLVLGKIIYGRDRRENWRNRKAAEYSGIAENERGQEKGGGEEMNVRYWQKSGQMGSSLSDAKPTVTLPFGL